MRKIISLLLCLSLLASLSVFAFAAGEQPSGSNYWFYNGSNTMGFDTFWSAVSRSLFYLGSESKMINSRIGDIRYQLQIDSDGTVYHLIKQIADSSSSNASQQILDLFTTGNMNTYIQHISNNSDSAMEHFANFQTSLNSITGVLGYTTDSFPLSIQAYSGMTYAKLGAVHNSLNIAKEFLHSIDSNVTAHLPVIDLTTQSIDAEQKSFHSDVNDHYAEFFDYFSVSDNPLTLRLYGRTAPTGPVSIQSVTDHSMMLLARNSADDPALAINTISNDKLSFADRMTAINNNLAYLGTIVSTASTRYKFNVKNYDTGVSSSNTVVSLFDWLYFFNENLGDQVQRLGYMFASDDDIAMKDSTKNDSQWVTDYYSGSDRAGVDDYSSVQGSVGAFNGFMSTGSSDNLGDGLAQIDNNGYSFWSSAVDQDINHSVVSGSSGKFSARSSSDCPVVIDFFSDNWREMGVNEIG